MLSFFSKKKHSPETQPEDVIQGPNGAQPSNGDDFIFVEKRDEPPPEPRAQDAIYPPMPANAFGLPYPGANFRPAAATAVGQQPIPYHNDVPFELAPQLCTKSNFELTQLQVDGILAVMTRQMSVQDQDEYNFALERSIQNECY